MSNATYQPSLGFAQATQDTNPTRRRGPLLLDLPVVQLGALVPDTFFLAFQRRHMEVLRCQIGFTSIWSIEANTTSTLKHCSHFLAILYLRELCAVEKMIPRFWPGIWLMYDCRCSLGLDGRRMWSISR